MCEDENRIIFEVEKYIESKYADGRASTEAIRGLLDLYQQEKEKNKELEDITRAYNGMKGIMPEGNPIVIADKEYFDSGRFVERYISKDKIMEMKRYREFELQQQYKDFENDIEWKTYNKILEEE